MRKNYTLIQMFKIMKEAFPRSELRPYSEQEKLFNTGKYKIIINEDSGIVRGFLNFWCLNNINFIEYIAVKSEFRGMGIGSEMIKRYLSENTRPTVLEVEIPLDGMKERRIKFYERLGFNLNFYFYNQPSFERWPSDVSMYMMSYPNRLTFRDFVHVKEEIYKNVYLM